MTPVQRLQAAIEKLEALKAEISPGAWTLFGSSTFGYGIERGYDADDPSAGTIVVARYEVADAEAELIITLHRTIDAQLEVLRSAADFLTNAEREWPAPIWDRHPELRDRLEGLLRFEVALADAILGGTQ